MLAWSTVLSVYLIKLGSARALTQSWGFSQDFTVIIIIMFDKISYDSILQTKSFSST